MLQHVLRLAVIDDDDITRSLQLRLEHSGFEVCRARNGKEGMRLALEWLPDAVVTDLVLPDGEGMFVLNQLKAHDETKSIPVIVLTGQGYEAIKRQVLQGGTAAYLTKPVNFGELLQSLKMQIKEAQVVKQLAHA